MSGLFLSHLQLVLPFPCSSCSILGSWPLLVFIAAGDFCFHSVFLVLSCCHCVDLCLLASINSSGSLLVVIPYSWFLPVVIPYSCVLLVVIVIPASLLLAFHIPSWFLCSFRICGSFLCSFRNCGSFLLPFIGPGTFFTSFLIPAFLVVISHSGSVLLSFLIPGPSCCHCLFLVPSSGQFLSLVLSCVHSAFVILFFVYIRIPGSFLCAFINPGSFLLSLLIPGCLLCPLSSWFMLVLIPTCGSLRFSFPILLGPYCLHSPCCFNSQFLVPSAYHCLFLVFPCCHSLFPGLFHCLFVVLSCFHSLVLFASAVDSLFLVLAWCIPIAGSSQKYRQLSETFHPHILLDGAHTLPTCYARPQLQGTRNQEKGIRKQKLKIQEPLRTVKSQAGLRNEAVLLLNGILKCGTPYYLFLIPCLCPTLR